MSTVFEKEVVRTVLLAGAASACLVGAAVVATEDRWLRPLRAKFWRKSAIPDDERGGALFALLERLANADAQDPVTYLEIARCVGRAIDEKDSYTSGHSERVAHYAWAIGKQMGLDAAELDRLRLAALLHDIGKLGVRSFLLNKPGRLTTAERTEMREHARYGANIVRSSANLGELLPGIELHHESWDGSGYPYGLHGEAIPRMARIIAVADTYDAVTSARPYQPAMLDGRAADLVRSLAGTRFCPTTVSAFMAAHHRGFLRLLTPESEPSPAAKKLAMDLSFVS